MRNISDTFAETLKRIAAKGGNTIENPTPVDIPPDNSDKNLEAVQGVKLKSFPDEVACLPNEWIRSGLFTASNKMPTVLNPHTGKKERVYVSKKNIPCFSDNVQLLYTGKELNQFDLRVWLTAIKESKREYLGHTTSLSPYEFCEAAKITRGGKNVGLVYESLERLFGGYLESRTFKNIDGNKVLARTYFEHLLHSFRTNKETNKWDIVLNPKLAPMFSYQTTWINWELLNRINGDIARSVALQIFSHEGAPENPQRISMNKVRLITGVACKDSYLRAAILNGIRQYQALGLTDTCTFQNDVLVFTKPRAE